jgi:hypothetical protein
VGLAGVARSGERGETAATSRASTIAMRPSCMAAVGAIAAIGRGAEHVLHEVRRVWNVHGAAADLGSGLGVKRRSARRAGRGGEPEASPRGRRAGPPRRVPLQLHLSLVGARQQRASRRGAPGRASRAASRRRHPTCGPSAAPAPSSRTGLAPARRAGELAEDGSADRPGGPGDEDHRAQAWSDGVITRR